MPNPSLHHGERGISYPTSLKYLYTVGLLNPQTLASSLTFSVPAMKAGYQKYTFSMYSGKVKHVKMRFRNNMMNAVIDKFGRQDYAHAVDKDHFEIMVPVAVSPQFYSWIFGLKNYATIISPPEVVEGMKEHLKAVMKRYE